MTGRGLCAVVLAAGAGTRLRPLTERRPKALCPIGNVTLLDQALGRLEQWGLAGPGEVAVNAHHQAEQIAAAVGARAHLSVEAPEALGTAGALGLLRRWIAGRDVLVLNADAYLADRLPGAFLDAGQPAGPGRGDMPEAGGGLGLGGWDGVRPRLLVVEAGSRRRDFDRWLFAGVSLLPAAIAARLRPEPAGLYELVWRDAWAAGALDLTPFGGVFVDCGTPADYLAANLDAVRRSTGATALVGADAEVTGEVIESVIGAGAVVAGRLRRCVVWPHARVEPDERLADTIRADDGTTVRVLPSEA